MKNCNRNETGKSHFYWITVGFLPLETFQFSRFSFLTARDLSMRDLLQSMMYWWMSKRCSYPKWRYEVESQQQAFPPDHFKNCENLSRSNIRPYQAPASSVKVHWHYFMLRMICRTDRPLTLKDQADCNGVPFDTPCWLFAWSFKINSTSPVITETDDGLKVDWHYLILRTKCQADGSGWQKVTHILSVCQCISCLFHSWGSYIRLHGSNNRLVSDITDCLYSRCCL